MLPSQSGAFWSRLPLPVLLIGVPVMGAFAVLVITWVSSWFGGTSLLLALILWLAVATGVLHSAGMLPWLDGQPYITTALDAYAPRVSARRAPPRAQPVSPTAQTGASTAPPDVSDFAGLDDVNKWLRDLIEDKGILANKVADAPLLLLLGPRGTGKSSIARSLPPRLQQAGILKTDKLVLISTKELPGLSDSHGPDSRTLDKLSAQLESALDGVVLLDDLDYLVSLAGGDVMHEIGSRLARLAENNRHRLVVIGTGSAEIFRRLDPGQHWVGNFARLEVQFPKFGPSALQTIAEQLLRNEGLRCTPEASSRLSMQLEWLAADSDFVNAKAVRTLVGEILLARAGRLRSDPGGTTQVIEDDIPTAPGT